jgi:drug/metabolite transporter (DMT)-like permease
LVIAACFFWGLDNNLTRDLEDLSPSVLASIKGLSAGTFNLLLAFVVSTSGMQEFSANLSSISALLTIGAFSYGVSLILFILALREIGSSRTSTYFSAGPFFGMLFSILILKESPGVADWGASALMLMGLWALYGETHEHVHTHEPITHCHRHSHDEHHQHAHEGRDAVTALQGTHEHLHTHEPLTHSHSHLPDIHHRH